MFLKYLMFLKFEKVPKNLQNLKNHLNQMFLKNLSYHFLLMSETRTAPFFPRLSLVASAREMSSP